VNNDVISEEGAIFFCVELKVIIESCVQGVGGFLRLWKSWWLRLRLHVATSWGCYDIVSRTCFFQQVKGICRLLIIVHWLHRCPSLLVHGKPDSHVVRRSARLAAPPPSVAGLFILKQSAVKTSVGTWK